MQLVTGVRRQSIKGKTAYIYIYTVVVCFMGSTVDGFIGNP